MRYGHIPGLGKPVSRLVQGVLTASANTQENDFRLMDAVWELGGNTFDTAHIYGHGESERTLGKWIRERGVRDRTVIITKGAHPDDDGRARVTPEDITRDLTESMERLQVGTIDIYLLHRDNPAVPVGPIVEALNEHQRAGRVRVFGGSNWLHTRLREANEYAAVHGLMPFGSTSPNFSLAVQVVPPWEGCQSISGEGGRAAREWYTERHMPVFAWSSLAGGFFSGRFHRDNPDTFTDYFDKLCVMSYCVEANFARLDRAQEMAGIKGMTLPQIALGYVLNQPLDIFALVGSRTGDEFKANAEACAVRLSTAELAWLENGS
jgi:aryl-alcohol dehydrogenase-like predicted oxidoreductase